MIDTQLLKSRVKGKVKFARFIYPHLAYKCEDGYTFLVPIEDTKSEENDNKFEGPGTPKHPEFKAEDKGMFFMRWIRKQMEFESMMLQKTIG